MKKIKLSIRMLLLSGLLVNAVASIAATSESIVINAINFSNKSAAVEVVNNEYVRIPAWEWLSYSAVTLAQSGTYLVEFNVSSAGDGRVVQIEKAGVGALASVNVPNTGGADSWVTVSLLLELNAGEIAFGIKEVGNGESFLKWFSLTLQGSHDQFTDPNIEIIGEWIEVEAENFSNKSSGAEIINDQYVRIPAWDWLSYNPVSLEHSGTYLVQLLVSSPGDGRIIQFEKAGEGVLAPVDIPNTGGAESWETVSFEQELVQGDIAFGIKEVGAGESFLNKFRLGLIVIKEPEDTVINTGSRAISVPVASNLSVFPTPSRGSDVSISFTLSEAQYVRLSIFDVSGRELEVLASSHLQMGGYNFSPQRALPSGIHIVRLVSGGSSHSAKIVVKQ